MIRRLFLDHPRDVGESYAEHFGVALRFGARMVAGGSACMVHALVPALFKTTGSGTVRMLHAEMIAKRGALRAEQQQMRTIDYVI